MTKRFIALIVGIAMAITTIPGCSGNNQAAGSSASAPAVSQSASAEATSAASAPAASEPEKITFTLFLDHTWFWIDSFGGRTVDNEITKRTGVSFDCTKAADAQQLPVLIASGSLPDMIYTATQSLWPKLSNTNMCYDWNSLIDQYAPDFPASPVEIANATQGDGKFYTIYNAYSPPDVWAKEPRMLPSNGSPTLAVRSDIMQALGNPPLNSIDDLSNVLSMVKAKYPAMDAIVLGDTLYGLPYFRRIFGGQTGDTRLWYDDASKTVKYRLEDPNEKTMMAYVNSLYRAGYLKPETLIYQVDQYRQDVYSGNAFAFVRSTSEADSANSQFQSAGLNYSAAILEKPLTTPNKPVVVNDGIGWSGTYITKACKRPDLAIKFLSYMKSPEGQTLAEFGIEGQTFTYDDQKYPVLTQEVKDLRSTDYNKMVQTYGLACWNFGVSAQTEALFNWNPQSPAIMNYLKSLGAIQQFRPWFQFVLPAAGTPLRDTYSKIGAYVDQQIYQVLAADSVDAFNTAYDQMLQTCNTMGLPDVMAYVNQQYPVISARYNK